MFDPSPLGEEQKSGVYIVPMNLHDKALSLAKEYRNTESALLHVLMQMQSEGLFLTLGYRNLFDYALRALKVSEAQASYFSKVALKSREVPELKKAIESGTLSLSKARRIVSVITKQNHAAWIDMAANTTQRELERAVSEVNPKAAIRERLRPVAKDRVELRMGISAEAEAQFRRVQDFLSQRLRRAATMEKVLECVVGEYLERHDPVKKAERATSRKVTPTPVVRGRRPVAKAVHHAVTRRDKGQCAFREKDGIRCGETRWLHSHHRTPAANGGLNTVDNLVTLCTAHHTMIHRSRGSKLPKGQTCTPH